VLGELGVHKEGRLEDGEVEGENKGATFLRSMKGGGARREGIEGEDEEKDWIWLRTRSLKIAS